jgi:hypothetical protein
VGLVGAGTNRGGKETDPLVAALEAADWEGWEVTEGAGTMS